MLRLHFLPLWSMTATCSFCPILCSTHQTILHHHLHLTSPSFILFFSHHLIWFMERAGVLTAQPSDVLHTPLQTPNFHEPYPTEGLQGSSFSYLTNFMQSGWGTKVETLHFCLLVFAILRTWWSRNNHNRPKHWGEKKNVGLSFFSPVLCFSRICSSSRSAI